MPLLLVAVSVSSSIYSLWDPFKPIKPKACFQLPSQVLLVLILTHTTSALSVLPASFPSSSCANSYSSVSLGLGHVQVNTYTVDCYAKFSMLPLSSVLLIVYMCILGFLSKLFLPTPSCIGKGGGLRVMEHPLSKAEKYNK